MQRQREIGWGIFLTGLPFAHFLLGLGALKSQWQAQTLYAQAGLALLFGLSLASSSITTPLANRPLGAWIVWTGLSVVGIWLAYLSHQQQHPIGLLPPLMHCVCLVLFYVAATRDWTSALLARLLRWVAYSGLVVVAYGFLQACNLDQFYRWIDGSKTTDTVIGTMGNPTHFGTHLALLLPIFLWQREWWWRLVAIATLILMTLTHSASALIACGAVLLLWSWRQSKAWGGLLVSLMIVGLLWSLRHPAWLNPSGRREAWQAFWRYYMVGNSKLQITGAGLGCVLDDVARRVPGLPVGWTHVHNSLFQVLIQQGVIGVGIVLWGLGDAIRRWWLLPRTALTQTLAGMGIAFLISAQVNFPDHLWVLASLGLFVYCGIYVLAAEEVERLNGTSLSVIT